MCNLSDSYCIDSNECQDGVTNNCSQMCTRNSGGYVCSCDNGYVQMSDLCLGVTIISIVVSSILLAIIVDFLNLRYR